MIQYSFCWWGEWGVTLAVSRGQYLKIERNVEMMVPRIKVPFYIYSAILSFNKTMGNKHESSQG